MLRAQPAPTLEFRMLPRPLRAPSARASQQTAAEIPLHQRILGQTRTAEPGEWKVASHSLPGGRPRHEVPSDCVGRVFYLCSKACQAVSSLPETDDEIAPSWYN